MWKYGGVRRFLIRLFHTNRFITQFGPLISLFLFILLAKGWCVLAFKCANLLFLYWFCILLEAATIQAPKMVVTDKWSCFGWFYVFLYLSSGFFTISVFLYFFSLLFCSVFYLFLCLLVLHFCLFVVSLLKYPFLLFFIVFLPYLDPSVGFARVIFSLIGNHMKM